MLVYEYLFSVVKFESSQVSAVIGSSVRFHCSTNRPPVAWNHCYIGCISPSVVYKNGRFHNGYAVADRFAVETSFAKFELIINDVQQDDAGVYECVDDAGVRREVTLNVDSRIIYLVYLFIYLFRHC